MTYTRSFLVWVSAGCMLWAGGGCAGSRTMTITSERYGEVDGREVRLFTLENSSGMMT